MTPAERTAKIAELRAEADWLEREGKRNWPEKITAGMLFRHHANGMYVTCFPDGGRGLVLTQIDSDSKTWMNGTYAGFRGFEEEEGRFTYLGYARDLLTIKTPDAPDAPEPTGAELVGKLVDVSDAFIPYMPAESGKAFRGPVGTTGFYCHGYTPGEMAPYTLIHHNAPKSIFRARTVTLSKDRP